MLRALGLLLLVVGGLAFYQASQGNKALTERYIQYGDGVEYADTGPLNKGGGFRRVNGPTAWETDQQRNDWLSVGAVMMIGIGAYVVWKANHSDV